MLLLPLRTRHSPPQKPFESPSRTSNLQSPATTVRILQTSVVLTISANQRIMAKLQMNMLKTNIDCCIEADKKKVEALGRKFSTITMSFHLNYTVPGSGIKQPLKTSYKKASNALPDFDLHVQQQAHRKRHRMVPNVGEEIRRSLRKRITLPRIIQQDQKAGLSQKSNAIKQTERTLSPLPEVRWRLPSASLLRGRFKIKNNTTVPLDNTDLTKTIKRHKDTKAGPFDVPDKQNSQQNRADDNAVDQGQSEVSGRRQCIVRVPVLDTTQEFDDLEAF